MRLLLTASSLPSRVRACEPTSRLEMFSLQHRRKKKLLLILQQHKMLNHSSAVRRERPRRENPRAEAAPKKAARVRCLRYDGREPLPDARLPQPMPALGCSPLRRFPACGLPAPQRSEEEEEEEERRLQPCPGGAGAG